MIRTTRRAFLASCGVASLLWIGSAGIESAQRLASQLAYRQLQSKTPAAANATPRSTSTATSASSKEVANLLDQNKDAAGWLVVENTAVSYPLVQASPKNKDWYLHHNFWNQKDVAGCPFVDDRCTASSQHVLVFGHHLGSTNLMFSSLASAWKSNVFQTLGSANIETVDNLVFRFKPLCALRVEKNYELVQRFEWPDADEMRNWLSLILGQAETKAQTAQEDAHKARQVLTLATCSNAVAGQQERTLIVFSR